MFPEDTFDFGPDQKGSIKTDLAGIKKLLREIRKRRIFFHSIEGHIVDKDGSWKIDLSISKKGLRGEDQFETLEEHYLVDEVILRRAEQYSDECKFEIWLSPEHDLPLREQ